MRSDIPPARLADVALCAVPLIACLLVATSCDDEPDPIEKPEPVGPKVKQVKDEVSALRDAASQTIEAQQPDTGLNLDKPD
jgi:hypothetical protein